MAKVRKQSYATCTPLRSAVIKKQYIGKRNYFVQVCIKIWAPPSLLRAGPKAETKNYNLFFSNLVKKIVKAEPH